MAEEPLAIRRIEWREVFPFTHLFRAFRIAIHPSKLVLALMALLCLYFGGRILDSIWRVSSPSGMPITGEITAYQRGADVSAFRRAERERATARYRDLLLLLADKGGEYDVLKKPENRETSSLKAEHASALAGEVLARRNQAIKEAHAAYAKVETETKDATRLLAAAAQRDAIVVRAYDEAQGRLNIIEDVRGRGVFSAFLFYERAQIQGVWSGVLSNSWMVDGGVIPSVLGFFVTGPGWLLRFHWFYFVLYAALFMAVWSLFGGAIARIAAVHFADEGRKLSIRQGLSFAAAKFLSFLLIAAIVLVVAAVSWVLFVTYAGMIVVSGLFIVALAVGVVLTMVIIGTAGGFGLMYPTIAVEGSDSFDAISRSFSYVYAKPWRMAFYCVVAIIYGAMTYLFVRFFIWLTLWLTQTSVGLFMFWETGASESYWNAIFPPVGSFWGPLPFDVDWSQLNTWGKVNAGITAFWIYLVIALLGAYAISFFMSASTIIYYLLRREVDATDLDDVYLEQPEEDFVETSPAAASGAPASPVAGAPTPASGGTRPAESDVPGEARPSETNAEPMAPSSEPGPEDENRPPGS